MTKILIKKPVIFKTIIKNFRIFIKSVLLNRLKFIFEIYLLYSIFRSIIIESHRLCRLSYEDRYANTCVSVISEVLNLPRHIDAEVRVVSYETLFIVAINFNAVTEFDGSTSFEVSRSFSARRMPMMMLRIRRATEIPTAKIVKRLNYGWLLCKFWLLNMNASIASYNINIITFCLFHSFTFNFFNYYLSHLSLIVILKGFLKDILLKKINKNNIIVLR